MIKVGLPFEDFVKSYSKRVGKSKNKAKSTLKIAKEEILNDSSDFIKDPSLEKALLLGRDILGSSAWVSRSYFRHFKNLAQVKPSKRETQNNIKRRYILNNVIADAEIKRQSITDADIFSVIFEERLFAHLNPHYESKLIPQKINATIVLVSGALNELFKTAAFERAAEHMQNEFGIKYFVADVKGVKSSVHNRELIKEQIENYHSQNPNEKLWILAFSKGGVDTLHFLKKNKEFCEQNVLGVSTIATPILGTSHLEHKFLKLLNHIHKYEDTEFYKIFERRDIDVFFKKFQTSLDKKYRTPWFQRNYKKLPQNIFYTSLALRSDWHESHVLMILTKFLLKSNEMNDGIVDAKYAHFPSYFESSNLGVIKGHHLIGSRSSLYCQEALIESLVCYLKYKKLL